MSKPIVIEVSGEPLGVVVPAGDAYRFLAVKFPVFSIDGQTFSSVADAKLAAANAVRDPAGRAEGHDAAA